MINFRVIFKIIGLLLVIEGAFLFLSFIVSLVYQESDMFALIISTIVTIVSGVGIYLITRNAPRKYGRREGYIIVSITWIVFSFFGALPFIIHGYIPNLTDAFFETMSGFTTTGASILNDIENMPHGLLFWRSLTQWLGGMGIIVLSLAILPLFGIGGMQLFVAEVPGPTPDKLHPRIKETAKRLWGIYVIYTSAEAVLLYLGGMSVFDAINHAFTTMATGGYSTKQASITDQTPYIQYVITLFMFLAGTNFTLSYFALKLKFPRIWKNEEFRYYLGFVLGFTLIIAVVMSVNNYQSTKMAISNIKKTIPKIEKSLRVIKEPMVENERIREHFNIMQQSFYNLENLMFDEQSDEYKAEVDKIRESVDKIKAKPITYELLELEKNFVIIEDAFLQIEEDQSVEKAFRDSLFQVVSIMTTTGFATADYLDWLPFLTVLIFMLMFFGGSAGSTGGGIKIIRLVLVLKNSALEFKRLLHPNAILPVHFDHHNVDQKITMNVLAFIGVYIIIFVLGTIVMSVMHLDLNTSMGATIACLGNIGPGIGDVGPSSNFFFIPAAGKWFLSFLMLMGRLELFTVLILFSPSFWRK